MAARAGQVRADEAAFTEFVHARSEVLRRAAYLICGDRAQADDLLQEALIALASRWESVDYPDAFVRRVIYNRRISWWRKHRREISTEELPETPVGDGAQERARDAEVHEALRGLPPRQRAALVLRYFEGLTEAEAAEVMRVRTGTIKSLSHQAIQRLRAELTSDWPARSGQEGLS